MFKPYSRRSSDGTTVTIGHPDAGHAASVIRKADGAVLFCSGHCSSRYTAFASARSWLRQNQNAVFGHDPGVHFIEGERHSAA